MLFGASLSAQAGDVGYGEYLAAECVTCHRADGAETAIPDIVGWEAAVFEIVFKAYKTGERDHKAMVSIAAGYDDEQIAALAAYFASIQPPEQ